MKITRRSLPLLAVSGVLAIVPVGAQAASHAMKRHHAMKHHAMKHHAMKHTMKK